MATGWTAERRAKQAELVRRWRPWEKSTGPRTAREKQRSSRNADRGGSKKRIRELTKVVNQAMQAQREAMKRVQPVRQGGQPTQLKIRRVVPIPSSGASQWREAPVAHVLVVDDDRDVRNFVTLVLEAEGMTVACAENGVAAMSALASGEIPNVILLDLDMPVMTGWEVLDALPKDARFCKVPVVIASGSVDSRVMGKAMVAIPKPLSPEHLVTILGAFTAPDTRSEQAWTPSNRESAPPLG